MNMREILKITIALLAGLLLTGFAFAQQKEQRVALVIGNNDYQYAKKLDNAVADAQAFRRELQARGFQVVFRENANRRAMNGAMEEFIGKLGTDAIGLVYYSGHGVQINGANYLVPTDLSAKTPSDFAYDAIDLEKLVNRVSQAQAKFSLAVIDACRDNPFQGNGKDIGGSRGLVAPSGNASGMMVVYSAGANQKALDRLSDADRNPNGLFTREFLKAMRIPGLTVQEAVNKIKTSVIAQAKSVGHVQTPAIYDQSVGTFMFTPGAPPAPVDNIVRPSPVVVAPALTAAQLEEKFWDDAKAAGNRDAFEAYLGSYPKGRYVSLARANIARFSKDVQVVSAPPVVAPVISPPVTKPVITTPARLPGGTLKDCDDCPEMVVIPAGSFEMGGQAAAETPPNRVGLGWPRHRVTLGAFVMGRTEVTQGQWRSLMGGNPSRFSACGDTCPVEQVSWTDAKLFISKLNAKTGKTYRLPSEAEWEYACRAGGHEAYCGSGRVDDLGWYDANSGRATQPVAGKKANAWGLHDMSGNVYEWTEDCGNANYSGAPSDGRAWVIGDCSRRVIRGGAWSVPPDLLHAAFRFMNPATDRYNSGIGFRVARDN